MVKLIPKTKMGCWSAILILCFFVFFVIMQIFVFLGMRGGETFFDNLPLSMCALFMFLCGVGSFVLGVVSILRYKERSIIIFISAIIGLLVLLFLLGELFIPH